jgi:hypothetical protein
MKKYYSTHNTCTKYIQNANITYDEPIKNVCHQKKKGIVTYLPRWLYLGLI